MLVIASRGSQLALWQARWVEAQLQALGHEVRIEIIKTTGDKITGVPLAKVGTKGLFTKEIEEALLDGRADLAVHSLKDVPMDMPEGFTLAAIMVREDPRDALVSGRCRALSELPPASVVGTSSLRREAQLRERYPQLAVKALRGNVNTRLDKLDAGQYAAIILAAAGLRRLGLAPRIAALLDPADSLPAIGQGALALECRTDRADVLAVLAPLSDAATTRATVAERAFGRVLAGNCRTPLAAYATDRGSQLWLRGLVASRDGSQVLRGERFATAGTVEEAASLGEALGAEFLQRGAAAILADA
jgi:hydroxymethylbilane synthase